MRRIFSCALVTVLPFAGGCGSRVETDNGAAGAATTTTSSSNAGGGGDTASTATDPPGGSGGTTATGGTTSIGGGGSGGATTTGGGGSGGMTTTSPLDEDEDQDGWTVAEGDCCDSPLRCGGGEAAALVNPGAFEIPGNGVDDDCNPLTSDSDPFPTCSTKAQAEMDILTQAPISNSKLVKAMDLCQFTTENPPPAQRTWGVISVKHTLADGSEVTPPKDIQMGILPDFGPNVLPQFGETMAALSTGTARRLNDPGIADPGYVHPQNGPGAGESGGFDAQTECSAPPSFIAANGGVLPAPCGTCQGDACTKAYDSVALRIRIRPPTNARSFSYRLNFFSAEYPESICGDSNDFFVALLDGVSAPDIPLDKNVARDLVGNSISVDNTYFNVCFPAPGAPPGSCNEGTLALIGNGMGGWNGAIKDGGGTGWIQNDVPLALESYPDPCLPEPGGKPIVETFELQLTLWDAGDHGGDSLILLDRFRWSPEASGELTCVNP